MRQAVIVSPTQFEVVDAATPTLRDDGDILVRTAACGICSGDLMPWYLEKKVGTVLGHEVVGWAVAVGRAVSHIQPGDLVFLHHHAPCLNCKDCQRGAYVHCAVWRSSKLDPGGMSEFVRVPAEIVRADAFAVNDLTPEQAVFVEPLGCCVKALSRRACSALQANSTAEFAIVGSGVMGLLNIIASRAFGAARVVAIEPNEERRRLARACGADEAMTPEEAAGFIRGACDFVVVGPGQPKVIREALGYVRPGGVALLFTPTPFGVKTDLDLGDIYFREISLVPSYSCGPEDTRQAYDLLRQGRVRVEQFVTHRFALDDIQAAYDTARRGGAVLKVLVTFGRS
jgi:L-iditol 2-dehydrogenase